MYATQTHCLIILCNNLYNTYTLQNTLQVIVEMMLTLVKHIVVYAIRLVAIKKNIYFL